ncbi:hypothetical protein SLA2020_498460 [Shorea laevis]
MTNTSDQGFRLSGRFSFYEFKLQLSGKRVVVVGLGDIGSEVARRLAAFWMQNCRRFNEGETICSISFLCQCRDLSANSDVFVVVHLQKKPLIYHQIGCHDGIKKGRGDC